MNIYKNESIRIVVIDDNQFVQMNKVKVNPNKHLLKEKKLSFSLFFLLCYKNKF